MVIEKDNVHRLIVSYSDKRAQKDAYNRQRGLKKLQQKVRSGKLTKEHLNNRGYNKFLQMEGEVKIAIDQTRITPGDSMGWFKRLYNQYELFAGAGNRDLWPTVACGKGISNLQDRPSNPPDVSLSQEAN
ncbi:MAG: hypothetical protein BWY69_00601 [Planctomycetes bacterium ADurb.Bin401]|nr:MAG: hypothetical protein BWY69_00601 [Planctomycetes bacterium ADurb.Bin401]